MNAPNKNELVVLFHGILRTARCMAKLAKGLENQGFTTLNIDYPSTRYDLSELVNIVNLEIQQHSDGYEKIHFVGYSMGGLLIRALLNEVRFNHLGRVVLLAPPNNGSEVADLLKNNFIFRKLYGPAGQQLVTGGQDVQLLFGKVYYPVGILAGTRTIDPFSSFLIKGANDGKVSVESTKLDEMTDHLCINTNHNYFPKHKAVIEQTIYFLLRGQFHR